MRYTFLCLLVHIVVFTSTAQTEITVASPNKNIAIQLNISKMQYAVLYKTKTVVQNSKLGIIRADERFDTALKIIKISPIIAIKDAYTILTAKKKNIVYQANEKTIETITKNGKKMNIVCRASNDGVAFKYVFPEKDNVVQKIVQEQTSFKFSNTTKAWLQPKTEAQSGWEHTNPSYEAHYLMDIPTGTPSPTQNGWVYPALFKTDNAWVLITEAGLDNNYCGTALQQFSPESEYKIGFPQAPEKFTNGVVNPESTLPWETPWRIITVGDLATIATSTLGTDLAKPSIPINTNWIKLGKASWSWIMLKDNSIVYDVQKKYIDFAASMHWEYCLIDADWDRKIGYEKMEELANYAASKNVGLLLWYNSAGTWNTVKYTPKDKLLTHESRMKEFERLHKMGIKGVKIDFFGGDGQSMIAYYHDILKDAATHELLVNFHGATLPRGWHRTYPNLMTAEAVYGYEMITFNQKDADVAAPHMVMSAFARNAFDPMDFTPVNLHKIPKINRKTTAAFELATGIIFISGIQHYAESPDGMEQAGSDAQQLMKQIPSVWEDVRFLNGYPGKSYTVARKAGNKWWIAGINADTTALQTKLDLNFVKKAKSTTLYTIDESTKKIVAKKLDVKEIRNYAINIASNDGFVLVIETQKQ